MSRNEIQSQQVIFAEHVYLVNYTHYPDNIHTYCVNKKQYHFLVEVNKANCFHRLKVSHWWTNRVLQWCLYIENIFLLHHHYPIRSLVRSFLPHIRKNGIFIVIPHFRTRRNNWNVVNATFYWDAPNFERKFCRLVYINNYELYPDWILPPLCK